MLKDIEGSSADVYKTLNAWIADFPAAPGFFGAAPSNLFWEVLWYFSGIHGLQVAETCGILHTICNETKFANFFLGGGLEHILEILRKQSYSRLMPNMAWAKEGIL